MGNLSLFVAGGLAILGAAVLAPMLIKNGGSIWPALTHSNQGSECATPKQGSEAAAPATQLPSRIVIIGGGLAGCTAALTTHAELQRIMPGSQGQVEIVLVDKMPKLGGNSAKASSGINALNPADGDSQELFESDTLQSGGGLSKPELVHALVGQSPEAIQFLESLGVGLSKVTVLGGHSKPRSRTNPVGGNVGWSIMSKAMAAVKGAPGIRVMEGHKLEELLLDPASGSIRGVRLSVAGKEAGAAPETLELPAQAVILATGGFAANRALLAQHNPDAAALATTNGPWAQGDVLALAAQIGARLKDLDQVQVHPTGFVDPADETAGTKFLAPEKLRGVGAIMINRKGHRFVDELSTRDVVAKAVGDQPGGEVFLVLPASGAEAYGMSAIQFYVTKKLMTQVQGVSGLAQHMGIPEHESTLAQELTAYNEAKEGRQTDAWGKTVLPAGFDPEGEMYVARITPVVHYTMGGVEIDEHARVLSEAGQPIPGLYAAGEVSGGVHGRNRLGGNSLLECTVFGRIAGANAVGQLLPSSS